MTHAWLTLTGPDGREQVSPSEQQMADVLAELYGKPSRAKTPRPASRAVPPCVSAMTMA
jgi:hypothetical protein